MSRPGGGGVRGAPPPCRQVIEGAFLLLPLKRARRSCRSCEVSAGRLVHCAPTGVRGSTGNQLGASVVGWDPAVKEVGVDTGYSPSPPTSRAPDVAVGNVPNRPGWVAGG